MSIRHKQTNDKVNCFELIPMYYFSLPLLLNIQSYFTDRENWDSNGKKLDNENTVPFLFANTDKAQGSEVLVTE